jgi:hypothetical protein
MTPEQHRFHNQLRILICIGRGELPELSDDEWRRFDGAPVRYFVTAPDAHKDAIWRVIEKRLRKDVGP